MVHKTVKVDLETYEAAKKLSKSRRQSMRVIYSEAVKALKREDSHVPGR